MRQYMRKVRLTFGGGEREAGTGSLSVGVPQLGHEDLRITFNIQAHIGGEQNQGSFNIWNLSNANRNKVGREWTEVTCEAGYVGAAGGAASAFSPTGIIFKGDITEHEHTREGADIRTYVESGEGDKAIRSGTVSFVVEDGGPREVVNKLMEEWGKLGISRGPMPGLNAIKENYKRPITLFGSVASELDKIGRAHGLYWWIRSGALEIIEATKGIQQTVHISPRTGMIGVPTVTDDGIKVATLLDPNIQPGRFVIVTSPTMGLEDSGPYRVDTAIYDGDNGQGPAPGHFIVSVLGTQLGGGGE